jgi:hypothetical protein
MSTKNQQSFSSVISINPYSDTYFSGISSFLSETPSPRYVKDTFAISYLNNQDFINSQIQISKNIPDEDLEDAINNKVYDELALDQAVEYEIQFVENFENIDAENRQFHVFIVDPSTIIKTYQTVVKKIKYLDTIIPTPLLLKSLYSKEIVRNNGAHCYIYFQENDTFVTIYNEKEFVYTKSIKYSFVQMHERFCELYGERISYEDFLNFLSKESLKETHSNYKTTVIKLYKEIFANINDILTYVKRAYELDKIEHIYIGSQIPTVTKLDEIIEVELNIKSSNFEFDYGFECKDKYLDQLHALMHVYASLPQTQKYSCNFSQFHRPPRFIKRDSGKIIMMVAASLLLAFAYPATYWILSYAQTLQYELLKQTYADLDNIKVTREATVNNKENDKKKALALLAQEQQNYIDKKNTLLKIHDVKVNYPMKAKLLTKITEDLNKFSIQLESLSYNENNNTRNFNLNLVSSEDKKITELLEYVTKKHEAEYNFALEIISYDEESKKYFSELKVKIL